LSVNLANATAQTVSHIFESVVYVSLFPR